MTVRETVMVATMPDPLAALERLHEQNRREIDARWQRSQLRLLVMFFITLLAAGIFHTLSLLPAAPPVTIRNLRATSETNLCAGDVLTYAYDLVGEEPAVVELTATIWRVTPPQTIIYSGTRRDILIPPVTHRGGESIVVPALVFDPTRPELVSITAGRYERRIAVTAVGRDTQDFAVALPFAVREDCNDGK